MAFPDWINTSGLLWEGEYIALYWPEPDEFDRLTDLRNTPQVRQWFLDDRPLDPVNNRIWLASGMNKPVEALLSIRLKTNQALLGMIGWSDWDFENHIAWFGRIAIDRSAIKQTQPLLPDGYKGVTLDAAFTLRDFVFLRMHLEAGYTYYFSGNKLAERINQSIGMKELRRVQRNRPDGTSVETIEMGMTRAQWLAISG